MSRCDSIQEKCRKARYFYTKNALSQNANLEINKDKAAVEDGLATLGFSQTLQQSLDYAEKMYNDSKTPFDLKTSVGHLRSFLEQLQAEGVTMIQKKKGGTLPTG